MTDASSYPATVRAWPRVSRAAPATWGAHLSGLLGGVEGVATIGFDELPQAAWASMQVGLAARTQQPFDGWLDVARSVLDATQQTAHREAAAICDRLFEALAPGGVLGFSMKEGDGEGWTTEKLDAPRYYVYWRAEPLVELVRECGWQPLAVSQAAGSWASWLYLTCRAE